MEASCMWMNRGKERKDYGSAIIQQGKNQKKLSMQEQPRNRKEQHMKKKKRSERRWTGLT